MAEAGLQVFNDKNTLTVDSTYQNLGLRSKVTLYTTIVRHGANRYDVSEVNVTYPLGQMVAAYVDPQYFVTMGHLYTINGGMVTQNYWVSKKSFVGGIHLDVGSSAPAGTPVEFFMFGEPVHTGNFGLQVFNQQGVLVFSSASGYMKVVAHWQSPVQNTAGMAGDFAYDATNQPKLAYVFSRHPWRDNLTWFKGDPWAYLEYSTNGVCMDAGMIHSRTWTWFSYMYQTNFDVPYNVNLLEHSILVLDVKGL
ncbi:MAG: hypothetical protein [Caudoviricetes sp.]|nr:MAG: hypothetical protein [Caudoviricetes sp.]